MRLRSAGLGPHSFKEFEAQALVRLRERAAGLGKACARACKAVGGMSDLLLQLVETLCHFADFVARMDDYRSEIEACLGSFEVARCECAHRSAKIGERPTD